MSSSYKTTTYYNLSNKETKNSHAAATLILAKTWWLLGRMLKRVCFSKFCKIHIKTPVPELLFNKVVGGSVRLYSVPSLFILISRQKISHFQLSFSSILYKFGLIDFRDLRFNISFPKRRRSCLQMFFKLGALKNFSIFKGKHLCWSSF